MSVATVDTEHSVTSIIQDYLERVDGAFEPATAAEVILAMLSEDQRQEMLIAGLRYRISDAIAHNRPRAVKTAAPRSIRWEQVAEVLANWRLCFIDRPPKSLLDSTVADLSDAAEWYEKRAEGYLARAAAYRQLARKMGREGGTVVGDLDHDVVWGILDAG